MGSVDRKSLLILLGLGLGLGLLALSLPAWRQRPADARAPQQAPPDRPLQVAEDGYVSSRECGACHPHHHATWHDSYHRSMTQLATPEAVLARFDDVELELDGETWRMQRRGEEFWAARSQGNGAADARPVVMTTGSHHFQVYWRPTGRGRKLELLPFAYQIAEARWIPMDALVLAHPSVRQRSVWNRSCIACHATAGRPRLREMDTRVAELGIACEACHGPAGEHVRLARDPRRRYALHLSDAPDPSIVDPSALSHRRSTEICGQCHSVNRVRDAQGLRAWKETGYAYRPGDELARTRWILDRDPPETGPGQTFWPDGMVRVNGREYNSLLDTPCFQRGELSCLSCHTLHQAPDDPRPRDQWADDQLARGMRGDAACTQCHPRFENESGLVAHTLHAAGSSGSRCYNCHMPYTAYGLHKATRSHQIGNPSVDESVRVGRPNACNLCHLDRTLAWSAQHLEAWYGIPPPELVPVQAQVAAGALWALTGDAGVRALAAWHMGWQPAQQASGADWLAPYLAQLLEDPYPAVRSVAYRSLRGLQGFEDLAYDFAGAASERAAAGRRALAIWRAAGGRSRLDRATFTTLLAHRDDRFVYLRE